jgi:hypothetical protein
VGKEFQDVNIRTEVTSEIGSLIACVASLEFEMDDLFCLANAQIDVVAAGVKRYPVQAAQKSEALAKIAHAVNAEWDNVAFSEKFQKVSELRQLLAHGRITAYSKEGMGYLLKVSKMSLPEKIDGIQKLTRDEHVASSDEVRECIAHLRELETRIESLRLVVFGHTGGWPNYHATPTKKPFEADRILSDFAVLAK